MNGRWASAILVNSGVTLARHAFFTTVLLLVLCPQSDKAQPVPSELPNCSARMDSGLRQRCEEEFSRRVAASNQTRELTGGWRLVKTPDPRGGPQTISVMHVSDTSKSDFGLAGITFRCGPTDIETLLVILDPLPRGSQPQVTVKDSRTEIQFKATAINGGQMLLLPQTASNSASGSWKSASELSLEIVADAISIKGVVPIAGLSGALEALSQACAAR